MEIKNCEQYVLTQLFEQQDENDRLEAINGRLREEVASLKDKLAMVEQEAGAPIRLAIEEAGRNTVYSRLAGYASAVVNGETVPFEEWAVEYVQKYGLPGNVTRAAAIKEFDAELRADYARSLEEDDE